MEHPYEYERERRGEYRGEWGPPRREFGYTSGERGERGRGEPYRAGEPPYYGTRFARGHDPSWRDEPRARRYEVEGGYGADPGRERARGLLGWFRERLRATAGWAAYRLHLGGTRIGDAVREGGARMGAGAERFGSAVRDAGEVTGYALGRGGERLGESVRVLGRVPKGYKRPDDRILDDVCERISRSWVDASDVEVQVRAGDVILSGRVPSKEHKYAIEDIAENVFGVVEVQNQLRVARPPQDAERGRGAAARVGEPGVPEAQSAGSTLGATGSLTGQPTTTTGGAGSPLVTPGGDIASSTPH